MKWQITLKHHKKEIKRILTRTTNKNLFVKVWQQYTNFETSLSRDFYESQSIPSQSINYQAQSSTVLKDEDHLNGRNGNPSVKPTINTYFDSVIAIDDQHEDSTWSTDVKRYSVIEINAHAPYKKWVGLTC